MTSDARAVGQKIDTAPQAGPPQDPHPARSRHAGPRLVRWVAQEKHGGLLLLAAAVAALVWANSPWRATYETVMGTVIGPHALHLDLTVATWAADGLLAIFFFVVGVELKQELVTGSLRDPRRAGVPMLAAVGGMIVPAVLFTVVLLLRGDTSALHGWAVPTATDIAFAISVLAVVGRGLPVAIRTFLLTLAVVDDLLAIIVIAVFYTDTVNWLTLAGAIACVVAFGALARAPRLTWPVRVAMLVLAVAAWALMHASGVHATIAGVLLGLTLPVRALRGRSDAAPSRAARAEHLVRPLSQGVALPLFAFCAAGVSLVDAGGPAAVLGQPVALAIIVALVVGKVVGVMGTTALVTRFTPLRLAQGIGVRDLLPIGLLAGIGFTVSLLVAELAFDDDLHTTAARAAILAASLIAACLAVVVLRHDVRRVRSADENRDGLPDDTDPEAVERIGDADD